MPKKSFLPPVENLQKFLDKALESRDELSVLEAGCGSSSHFNFRQKVHLSGIDISEKQLQRNKQLQDAILGDIQYYEFQPNSYDVIICWAVLEHLQEPMLALHKFNKAIKKVGLIVLELPNAFSLKGLLTTYTPFCIHTWYYRNIMGRKMVGKDDVGPFKTYLKFSIAPDRIKKYASQTGLEIAYFKTGDLGNMPYWVEKTRIARILIRIYKLLRDFGKIVSFGRLGDSDFVIVLKK